MSASPALSKIPLIFGSALAATAGVIRRLVVGVLLIEEMPPSAAGLGRIECSHTHTPMLCSMLLGRPLQDKMTGIHAERPFAGVVEVHASPGLRPIDLLPGPDIGIDGVIRGGLEVRTTIGLGPGPDPTTVSGLLDLGLEPLPRIDSCYSHGGA